MIELLSDPAVWMSFVTLCLLEIVLGFDNLVLISILSDKVVPSKRSLARRLGLGIALVTRIMLLSLIFILAHLTDTLFTVLDKDISARGLILIFGGLFLIAKGTLEIHGKIEGDDHNPSGGAKFSAFAFIIFLEK